LAAEKTHYGNFPSHQYHIWIFDPQVVEWQWEKPSCGYETALGRFLFHTMDPFEGRLCDPKSLHKYLYVYSNPVILVDPSGLFAESLNLAGQQVVMAIQAMMRGISIGFSIGRVATVRSLLTRYYPYIILATVGFTATLVDCKVEEVEFGSPGFPLCTIRCKVRGSSGVGVRIGRVPCPTGSEVGDSVPSPGPEGWPHPDSW